MDTNRHVSRSRSQTTAYSWPAQVKYSNHSNHTGGVTESNAGSAEYESFHEIISSGYGRSKFNHCFHYVKRDNGLKGLFTGQHLLQASGTPPLDCVNPRTGPARFSRIAHLAAIDAAKIALGATFLNESWNSWSTKGITKLQPDLTEISLPNFFYELKDIKKSILVKAQKGVYTKGLSAAKRLLYLKRNARNLSTAALPAELVLELEYAVKPLINDLKEIWASMVSTRGKMDAWIASVGARKTKSGTLSKAVDVSSGTITSVPGLSAGHSVTWSAKREQSMVAFLRYRPLPFHNIKLLQGPLAFLDRYGVQLDALSVWNAIPFTFLLDYVLNIDQVLSNWHIDACELPIQIEDFCLQYKYDLKISSTHTATFTAFSPSQNVVEVSPTWDYQETVFRRFPCIPHESGLIELGWKSPKLRQWWLTFNLATAIAAGGNAPKRS